MSFLLDTDTCSAHLKGHAKVIQRCLQYAGRLHISVIGLGELYTWALRAKAPPKRLHHLIDFLKGVDVLDVRLAIAEQFGAIRASLMDRGLPTPDLDLLHAATALFHGLTVVTHNAADSANIPGLKVVDWMAP
jgi:tRNA(fMet)-specific endonuclease VapC